MYISSLSLLTLLRGQKHLKIAYDRVEVLVSVYPSNLNITCVYNKTTLKLLS
nr:MAG TPA: hypothetical protein [Siphoviridae sp. ctEy724]